MARRKILSAKLLKLRTGVTLRATQNDVDANSEVNRLIDLLEEYERTGNTSSFVLRALLNQMRLDESGNRDVPHREPSRQQENTRLGVTDKQSELLPAADPVGSMLARPAIVSNAALGRTEGLSPQADPLVDSLVRQFETTSASASQDSPSAPEPSGALSGEKKPNKRKMGAGALAAMG